MKLKLNELHTADWRYVNCPTVNLYEGKQVAYRMSMKYGYRFTIVDLHGTIYIAQALYNPTNNTESISIHEAHSVNDAKAIIEVMIQFITNMHRKVPVTNA